MAAGRNSLILLGAFVVALVIAPFLGLPIAPFSFAQPPYETDLEVVKTADPSDGQNLAPGDQIVYTFTVTNNGPDDATGVVMTDDLPSEVNYVSNDCGGSNVPPFTWNIGNLPNGGFVFCNVTVVLNGTYAGTVENVANVGGNEPDPIPENDASSVEVSGFSVAIPALGRAGFVGLVLLLGMIGFVVLRRPSH